MDDALARARRAVEAACREFSAPADFAAKADAINTAQWTLLGEHFKAPACCVAFFVEVRLRRTERARAMTPAEFAARLVDGVYLCDACAVTQLMRDARALATLGEEACGSMSTALVSESRPSTVGKQITATRNLQLEAQMNSAKRLTAAAMFAAALNVVVLLLLLYRLKQRQA